MCAVIGRAHAKLSRHHSWSLVELDSVARRMSRLFGRRDGPAPPCRSKDLYVAPAAGAKVPVGSVTVRWQPSCLQGISDSLDLYLYSQQQLQSALPVHAWTRIRAGAGAINIQVDPSWWNASDSATLNMQFVPTGSQPWQSELPLSAAWIATNEQRHGDSSYVPKASNAVSQMTPGGSPPSGSLSKGSLAAAIVVPVVVVLLALGATVAWFLHNKNEKDARARRQSSRYSQYAYPTSQPSMSGPSEPVVPSLGERTMPGDQVATGEYAAQPESMWHMEPGQYVTSAVGTDGTVASAVPGSAPASYEAAGQPISEDSAPATSQTSSAEMPSKSRESKGRRRRGRTEESKPTRYSHATRKQRSAASLASPDPYEEPASTGEEDVDVLPATRAEAEQQPRRIRRPAPPPVPAQYDDESEGETDRTFSAFDDYRLTGRRSARSMSVRDHNSVAGASAGQDFEYPSGAAPNPPQSRLSHRTSLRTAQTHEGEEEDEFHDF